MTSGEERDRNVVDAYRAAADALDERPSAATRAAILAAAARAVDAQPRDAATGAGARSAVRRASGAPWGASRRPLALVASFFVATVAVVLATRVEREPSEILAQRAEAPMPAEPKPAKPDAIEAARDAGAATNAVVAAPPAEPSVNGRTVARAIKDNRSADNGARTQAVLEAERARQRAAATPEAAAPAKATADTRESATALLEKRASVADAAPATSADKRAAPTARPSAAEAAAPPPAIKALTAPPAASSAPAPATPSVGAPAPAAPAPPAVAQRRDAEKDMARQKEEAPARLAKPFAAAPLDQVAPAQEPHANAAAPAEQSSGQVKARPVTRTPAVSGTEVEDDPAKWLQRIITLREAGQDVDADRELTRLRERYPAQEIPPAALRRAGTR